MNSRNTIFEQSSKGTTLQAFVVNQDKHLAGETIGEWISLPTTREMLLGVFQKIGVEDGYYSITDYDCSEFPKLTDCFGEYEDLDELNYLAAKLQEVSQNSVLTDEFSAALEMGKDAGSVKDLINLTTPYNLNNRTMLIGVCNDEELGRQIVKEGKYDLESMGELAQYIDYEALGRDTRINEGGIFTNRGYFTPNSDGLYEFYKSVEDIPQEYLITVDATQTAAEAMAENMSAGMTMG